MLPWPPGGRCGPDFIFALDASLGARRQVSTRSRGMSPGFARYCPDGGSFTEFDAIHTAGFPCRCSNFKSLVSADSTIPAWNVCYYIISKLQKQAFYFVIFIFLSDKSTWDMVHSYVLSHVRFHASIVDARNTNIVFAVIFLCFVNPVNFTFMLLPQHGERIKINPNFVAALFLRFIKNKLHTQM